MPRIFSQLTSIAVSIPLLILPIACKHNDASAGAAQSSTHAARQHESLRPIDYTRTGGLLGTEDHIHILPSGEIRVRGRMLGNAHGRLTDDQLRELAELFEGWDQLAPHYPSPPNTADAHEFEIQYGHKKVRATEASEHLPPQFTRIREKLESLAQGLAREQ